MLEHGEHKEVQIRIKVMTGMSGESKVVQALAGLEGVKNASASHPEKKAVVVYDPASVTLEQIRDALMKAGYVASFVNNDNHQATESVSDVKSGIGIGDMVCYCFEFTKEDIEQDYIKNGQSTIAGRIASEKRSGGCDCTNKNPKGRGCLADVHQVVENLKHKAVSGVIAEMM